MPAISARHVTYRYGDRRAVDDKRAARNGLWRVSERTLLTIVAFGGTIGAIAARGTAAITPPGKNAKPWKRDSPGAIARNEALRASRWVTRSTTGLRWHLDRSGGRSPRRHHRP